MHLGALRALEFDRIATVVASLAVTPTGRDRLMDLHPATAPSEVCAALRETSEGVRFLADHPGFPLRAPSDLKSLLDALSVEGRALEPRRLVALSDYLESIERSRSTVLALDSTFRALRALVDAVASFRVEIADVRHAIDAAGEVVDEASPGLAAIRGRLRKQRARLRTTLEGFVRGRETSRYLQEQVITDRNGRYVLVVKAEHRSAIPGIVHGASASGASLFLEPLGTVEINNDIVGLEQQEAEEVQRILLALTDAFRARTTDLGLTIDAGTALDVVQARARFSRVIGGIEPAISRDGALELRRAKHPLLMSEVIERLTGEARGSSPVPVDLLLVPPAHVLVITGPNTGGKTVALKTAGLLAAMVQAGLHIPVAEGSRLPIFSSLFADIGDEQSISASLSTFSAHIVNVVAMDRNLALPALVLLDEVGAGTDPVEGGALGASVIDHLRRRGAHVIATTHFDSLKSYASTTEGVACAAFGFHPETFAPTYQLLYGSPGRSLALEIAARLGMPPSVIAAARGNLGDRETQLAEHLSRIDAELRSAERSRRQLQQERELLREAETKVRAREEAVRERELAFRRKLDARLNDHVREVRKEIEAVIDGFKARVAELSQRAAEAPVLRRIAGEAGNARSEARAAIDRIMDQIGSSTTPAPEPVTSAPSSEQLLPGVRVVVGPLGLEGAVIKVQDGRAEIDVRGKRLHASLEDLRIVGPAPAARVKVNVDLQPRETALAELNVIGCTVDEAVARTEKFLDASAVSDQQTVRIVHGHGTGQLRRSLAEFLKNHPLVARIDAAPPHQGGSGVTVVELKD
jgi:DNA mismatch repair protein MutS2